MGQKLMEALRTFRVDGELVGRTTGPVVTQFEIEPAPGVKVRQFANLAERPRARHARAEHSHRGADSRAAAPWASRCRTRSREMVCVPRADRVARVPVGARGAARSRSARTSRGSPVIADLAKMPHLLIAGATGSGKSVCVNTIITSLVYRHTPKTLRFLMVDPKMVELSVYNTLPHLRHKVITDNRDAASRAQVGRDGDAGALRAARRQRRAQHPGVQQAGAGRRAAAAAEEPGRRVRGSRRTRAAILPYIVVVIDELADLMMTVQGEVETPLAMLAQKARAIGIHLILATQRPSVNVITGLIKANFPSRIAFRVASQVDSRTIIDGIGAEALLGNGDMLFIPPGKSEPQRLQGAFIPSEDTERLMGWFEDRRDVRRAALAAKGWSSPKRGDEADILAGGARSRGAGRRALTRMMRSPAGEARHAVPRGGRGRASSTSWDRRRCCSADSRSAMAARRGSSTSSTRPACSDRLTGRSPATS